MASERAKADTRSWWVDSAIIVSPLLNLAPAPPTGPTIVHRSRLLSFAEDDGLSGTATLTLAPDHRMLIVQVEAVDARPIAVRIRRALFDVSGVDDPRLAEGALVIEVCAIGRGPARPLSATFDLAVRDSHLPLLLPSEMGRLAAEVAKLSAFSIEGMSAAKATAASAQPTCGDPSHARQAGDRPPYFHDRMLAEIDAALGCDHATAAAKHVELANLYARRLQLSHP